MTTLQDAYRHWLKRYPSWKMERAIRAENENLGYVLMDSNSQRRKVFVFVRLEFETSVQVRDQSIVVPQIIVDGLSMKDTRPSMIIAVRGRFFEADARKIVDHRFTKREMAGDVRMYRFVLSHVEAWDITESMVRVVQPALALDTVAGNQGS